MRHDVIILFEDYYVVVIIMKSLNHSTWKDESNFKRITSRNEHSESRHVYWLVLNTYPLEDLHGSRTIFIVGSESCISLVLQHVIEIEI